MKPSDRVNAIANEMIEGFKSSKFSDWPFMDYREQKEKWNEAYHFALLQYLDEQYEKSKEGA